MSRSAFIVLIFAAIGLYSASSDTVSDRSAVPPTTAPKEKCTGGRHDGWTNCATDTCEPTCQSRYPKCPKTPCFGACRCEKGFFRRSDGCCAGVRQCVRVGLCE